MSSYSHIIWDWNGTLLDDIDWSIACINRMLHKRKLRELDSIDDYHNVFGFPIIDYYRRLGFDFSIEPFDKLAIEYINYYHSNSSHIKIYPNTVDTLRDISSFGISQNIISASEQSNLMSQIIYFNISEYFDRILGISDIYASSKLSIAQNYFLEVKPYKALMIGDTIHDKEVADILGIDCILINGGHQSKKELIKANATVIDSISDVKLYISKI